MLILGACVAVFRVPGFARFLQLWLNQSTRAVEQPRHVSLSDQEQKFQCPSIYREFGNLCIAKTHFEC